MTIEALVEIIHLAGSENGRKRVKIGLNYTKAVEKNELTLSMKMIHISASRDVCVCYNAHVSIEHILVCVHVQYLWRLLT
jgi:hypothetical protein